MMRPKTHRRFARWWAAIQQEWHRRQALRLQRMVEASGRQALRMRNRAVHHERRAKHFQLRQISLREK
jgi:hypothetical protein